MKKTFLLITSLLLAVTSVSRAQNPIVDKYPAATIYVIDPQTGQEVLAQNDDAVLFKDAFIDLVKNTNRVKAMRGNNHNIPIVITQTDPADGNGFQLTQQGKFLGQMITKYTFSYNVDENTLYYLDPNTQNWNPELVQGYNVVNLNNCLAYGKFNEIQPADANGSDVQQTGDDGSDDGITANTPPPALQDYDQPECPQDDYLWQPGYWAYNPGGGYYWVAGEWVAPPSTGLLWTPPYWGYVGARYVFHAGYWGSEIGFYGGVNYGYGYAGVGFVGGNWYGGHFRYNTAVVHVNGRIRNVYVDRSVVHVGVRVNVSFNGPGGTANRPTDRELKANNDKHIRDIKQNPKAATINHNGRANNGAKNVNGRVPGNNNGNHKAPANVQAGQKAPGNGHATPGAQGNGPAVPKGPKHGNHGGGRSPNSGKKK